MTDTRAPRPTDLVALVTFDEEVRENQAITRDHLGASNEPPKPLGAAVEQWLHLGRRMWISLHGREIYGIATARELASRAAWEIDTLVDAPGAGEDVTVDLLRQAARAAREAGVTRVLLRTALGSGTAAVAPRAGFRRVMEERLWIGHPSAVDPGEAASVREATPADDHARFVIYSRALPVTAREALAMTQEEWRGIQDTRWAERGAPRLVEERDGQVCAHICAASRGQFHLVAAPGVQRAGLALLEALTVCLPEAHDYFGLVVSGSPAEDAVRAAGLEPAGEYALFSLRVSQPVRDEAFARAGIAITGG